MSSMDLSEVVARLEQAESTILKQQNEIQDLKEEVDCLKGLEDRKKHSLFSARLTVPEKDLTNSFEPVQENEKVYKASRSFDTTTCRYTASEEGYYSMNVAMRQINRGSLEVMMMRKKQGDAKEDHLYVGKTKGDMSTCGKKVLVALNKNDTVHVVVRRLSKKPKIFWIMFEGHLLHSTADFLQREVSSEPSE